MGGKLWLFLLLGCCLLAGCQQTETVSVPPAVGCYPVEGYAPDPADLAVLVVPVVPRPWGPQNPALPRN